MGRKLAAAESFCRVALNCNDKETMGYIKEEREDNYYRAHFTNRCNATSAKLIEVLFRDASEKMSRYIISSQPY